MQQLKALFQSMWKFIRFELVLASFWMIFFLVFRIVFFVYHHSIYGDFKVSLLAMSIWNGLYMDISMVAYLLILPALFWSFFYWLKPGTWMKIFSTFHLLLLLLLGFIFTADLEIFGNWGHRIDSAILPYLHYPKEAIASSSSSPIRILFTIFGLSFMIPMMFWVEANKPIIRTLRSDASPIFLSGILPALLLIIPIRGGLQLAPMNQSSVYFSSERVLNQSAENPLWILLQSLLDDVDSKSLDKEYVRFSDVAADSVYATFYPNKESVSSQLKLVDENANVVVIVWESLTANVVGSFGGQFPSTPNLDKLSAESLNFSNIYATGDRSDKGLAAILSGVPAVGKTSIMLYPEKVSKLPFLPHIFKQHGYATTYLYGGDLEFANMKNYMLMAGFQHLIGKDDFSKESLGSKWGAHDEFVFAKQLEIAKTEKQPFFHTLFTLSSHEPFDIPGLKGDEKEPVESLFCKAHSYTDRCLGVWLREAKKSKWWNNTLVVIVADHGHGLPGRLRDEDQRRYWIPMLWTGGALNIQKQTQISKLGSQTDFPATLLSQFGWPSNKFKFSQNLFDSSSNGFSFYAFRNGSALLQFENNSLVNSKKAAELYLQKAYETYYQSGKL